MNPDSELNSDQIAFGKEITVTKNLGDIWDKYDKIALIGSGAFGEVYRIQNKITEGTFACKILAKEMIEDKEKFDLETRIMTTADHPSIIKLYEVYEDDINVFLVMEKPVMNCTFLFVGMTPT